MVLSFRRLRYFLFGVCLNGVAPHAVQAQEIWFSPNASEDFAKLFDADAAWNSAAGHVKVFKLYGSYLVKLSQPEIEKIVSGLKSRNIEIALETGVMNVGWTANAPACGGEGRVEGYGTPERAKEEAKRIKAAGGSIKFLAMDEPLFYGHYFAGYPGKQPGCHSGIGEIVDLLLPTIRAYQEQFPDLVVGDIEPTDIADQKNWKADVNEFALTFKKKFGKPLAFLHLDVPFPRRDEANYAVAMFRYSEELKAQKLLDKIGIIYNGTAKDEDDSSWTRSARSHVALLEDELHLRPDQAIFQSWSKFPTHALPDTSPDTLTGTVLYYARRAH